MASFCRRFPGEVLADLVWSCFESVQGVKVCVGRLFSSVVSPRDEDETNFCEEGLLAFEELVDALSKEP